MSYSFLRFRTLEEFIDYLKTLSIHRYGLVINVEISHSTPLHQEKGGVAGISLSWRLTAKDGTEKEILVLDIMYYHDVYLSIEHARMQSAETEKKLLARIDKVFAERSKAPIEYQFTRIEAEFKVSAL